MALVTLADQNKGKGKDKVTENYSTGLIGRGFLVDPVDLIICKLEEYCEFSGGYSGRGSGRIGGPVADKSWGTTIHTEKEGDIKVDITQKYKQPGPKAIQADATISYQKGVLDEDLEIIRKAVSSSGLPKVVDKKD